MERERELGVASDRGEKRSKVQRHHVSGGNLASLPPTRVACAAAQMMMEMINQDVAE